jgi:hypothetical protein
MVAVDRVAVGLIGNNAMASPASSKSTTSPPQKEDAAMLELLKEVVAAQAETNAAQLETIARLAAIDARLAAIERRLAPVAVDPSVDVALAVVKADALTLQQAAGLIDHDEKTIRRWCKDFGVGFELGGKLYVFESKLLARVNNITRVQKRSAD